MKHATLRAATTALLSIGLTIAGSAAQAAWSERTVNGITYGYELEAPLIHFKLACPTTGWVALGLEPTKMMADADILIGYVDAQGNAHMRDDYGDSKKTHKADTVLGGTDQLTEVSGTESGGVTTLYFTIPLEATESTDVTLGIGKTISVILACGKNGKDDYTSMHSKIATDTFVLNP